MLVGRIQRLSPSPSERRGSRWSGRQIVSANVMWSEPLNKRLALCIDPFSKIRKSNRSSLHAVRLEIVESSLATKPYLAAAVVARTAIKPSTFQPCQRSKL